MAKTIQVQAERTMRANANMHRFLQPTTIDRLMERVQDMGRVEEVDFSPSQVQQVPELEKYRMLVYSGGHRAVNADKLIGVRKKVKYMVVQPQDAFMPLLEAIKSSGYRKVDAYVDETNGMRQFIAVATDQSIKADDGQKIKLGWLLKNSFDAKSSVFIGGFGLRILCTNQMTLRNLMGYMASRHVGENIRFDDKLSAFIESIDGSKDGVLRAIEKAMARKLDRETTRKLLESMRYKPGFVEKAMGKLPALSEKGSEVSLWDVYNAVTDTASHDLRSYTRTIKMVNAAEELIAPRATVGPMKILADA